MKGWLWGWGASVVMVALCSCREAEREPAERNAEVEAASYVLARDDNRDPDGTVVTVSHAVEMPEASMTISEGGKRRVGTMSMATARELRMKVLSEMETRLEVMKDERSVTRTVDGVPERSPAWTNPLLGKSVLFRFANGQWTGELEDGEADEEERRVIDSLTSELGNREDVEMFGTAPRQVGESWAIDPQIASVLSEGATFSGNYVLRFDRVEEFGGERCAVLLGDIHVRSGSGSGGGAGNEIEVVGSATIIRSLDHFVNRRLEISGTILMREEPAPGESLIVRGPVKIVQEAELRLP